MARKKSMLKIASEVATEAVKIPEVEVTTLFNMEDCLPFPTDLTIESYTELGRLFTNYTAFLAYMNERIAVLKLQKQQLKTGQRRRKALVIFGAKGIKMQKIAAVWRDPEFNAFQNKLQEVEVDLVAYYNMMWTLKEYLRAVEFERDRRGMKIRADG